MTFTPPDWTSADRVRKIREQRGLTVRELAARAGVNTDTIVEVEKGARGTSPKTWAKLAEALGAPVEWLRDGTTPGSA